MSVGIQLIPNQSNRGQRYSDTSPFIGSFLTEKVSQLLRQRDHLEDHRKKLRIEREFKCHICGKGFKTKRGVSAHIYTVHDIKPEQVDKDQTSSSDDKKVLIYIF